MSDIKLIKKTLVSKKSGKPFTAYVFKAGEYESLVFPSRIEAMYLDEFVEE